MSIDIGHRSCIEFRQACSVFKCKSAAQHLATACLLAWQRRIPQHRWSCVVETVGSKPGFRGQVVASTRKQRCMHRCRCCNTVVSCGRQVLPYESSTTGTMHAELAAHSSNRNNFHNDIVRILRHEHISSALACTQCLRRSAGASCDQVHDKRAHICVCLPENISLWVSERQTGLWFAHVTSVSRSELCAKVATVLPCVQLKLRVTSCGLCYRPQ